MQKQSIPEYTAHDAIRRRVELTKYTLEEASNGPEEERRGRE